MAIVRLKLWIRHALWGFVIGGTQAVCPAWASELLDIRYLHSAERSRFVLDLSAPSEFKSLNLSDPERFVVDMPGVQVSKEVLEKKRDWGPFVHRMRHGQVRDHTARVVFDMKARAEANVFVLLPQKNYGHRLVIDFARRTPNKLKTAGPINVVIDPGHGGKDPGAVSNGILEKDIVLKVANMVVNRLNRTSRIHAQLTRDRDHYVGLRERTQSARGKNADVFVSIHADAAPNRKARGASVYVLSNSGASSELARVLADHANRGDYLAGGVSVRESEKQVAATLLDFSMDYKITESERLARVLLHELAKVTQLHSKQVGRAGFAVLKNPDLPAVLVEIGFITNQAEAKRLVKKANLSRIATSIAKAIARYALRGSN